MKSHAFPIFSFSPFFLFFSFFPFFPFFFFPPVLPPLSECRPGRIVPSAPPLGTPLGWSWSRSCLGLKTKCLGLVSGLVPEGLVYKRIFWSFFPYKFKTVFFFIINTWFVSHLFKRRATQSAMWHNINNNNYCLQLITLSTKIESISSES